MPPLDAKTLPTHVERLGHAPGLRALVPRALDRGHHEVEPEARER